MIDDNRETERACFIDDNCKTCEHSSESHHAGSGKCYTCPANKRCGKFVRKHEEKMAR